MERGLATLRCIVCQRLFERDWPIPEGPDYVYAGVCPDCKDKP